MLAWRLRRSADPPPVLALLAVFVLAAESMEKGQGMAPHNYYGRLDSALRLPSGLHKRLEHNYRESAEELFEALNVWLTAKEGARGLPTAIPAPPHPFVGLPISQALVRADDRARLRRMFADFGLPPGEVLPASDMQVLIKQWIGEGHGSASLRRLWAATSDVRQRVVELALAELAVWDGAGLAERSSGDLRVVAQLRGMLGKRLTISLSAEISGVTTGLALDALDPGGKIIGSVDFVTDGTGRLLASNPAALDPISILAGKVRFRQPGTGAELVHQPRALYVLQRDEGGQLAIERERVALGGDCLILALARLRKPTEELLREVARPGWKIDTKLPGLPDGWVCASGVQVVALPTRSITQYPAELGALLPAAVSQVIVSDGLVIPGASRRWSSMRPPEVRAIAVGGPQVEVSIARAGDPSGAPIVPRTRSTEGIVVLPLAELGLDDGDYVISVETERRGEPQVRAVRLRSSATVEAALHQAPYSHSPNASAQWALTASPDTPNGPHVVGARVVGAFADQDVPALARRVPLWPEARLNHRPPADEQAVKPRAIAVIVQGDCVESGAHRMQLPEAKSRGFIKGTCLSCGLMKRYPATWYELAHRSGKAGGGGPQRARAEFMVPIDRSDSGADWASVVDTVFYLGAGRDVDMVRLASQLTVDSPDSQGVVTDGFVRALEAMGHIEVIRGTDGRAQLWQVTPPMLAQVSDGSFVLTGWRNPGYVSSLGAAVRSAGGRLEHESPVSSPPVVRVRGVTAPELALAVSGARLDPAPAIVEDAGARLAGVLPALSSILPSLTEVPTPRTRVMKAWDPSVARWQKVTTPQHGAMQFSGFSVAYGWVDSPGRDATMRVGDSRLVKHLASLVSGVPLISYSPDNEQLVVPMGADLPGLFGRAAVLASGQLPIANPKQGALIYASVPEGLAVAIISRLAS
jgi:hypothetical protein